MRRCWTSAATRPVAETWAAAARRAVETTYNARHMWHELADVMRAEVSSTDPSVRQPPRRTDVSTNRSRENSVRAQACGEVGSSLARLRDRQDAHERRVSDRRFVARAKKSSSGPTPSAPTVVVTVGVPWSNASMVLNFTPAP